VENTIRSCCVCGREEEEEIDTSATEPLKIMADKKVKGKTQYLILKFDDGADYWCD